MSDFPRSSAWLSRPLIGALTIAGLVALLQIPIALIRAMIDERVETRQEALSDVRDTWGGGQSVVGPRLVVPVARSTDDGVEQEAVSFLPATLEIDGNVEARSLARGLFTVPVYDAVLTLRGHFDPLDVASLGLGDREIVWERASLVVELTDPKSVGSGSGVTWRGEDVRLLPGAVGSADRPGVHAPVGGAGEESVAFQIVLSLKGSSAIRFVPFARETRVRLTSNWPHPSFSGAWLPAEREVAAGGFSATWTVPFLGRSYGQAWTAATDPHDRILESRFGADLVSPVDHYRMSERSTKYAPLFLALTFGILWLFDTLAGARVHPIQYLLVGAGMCLFYLLVLSFSEHIGFVGAYTVAAGAVVALTAMYTKAVLGSIARGATIGGAMAGLYTYLLALLSLERYALVAGSLGLFAVLATVMYLTRWVDWDGVGRAEGDGID